MLEGDSSGCCCGTVCPTHTWLWAPEPSPHTQVSIGKARVIQLQIQMNQSKTDPSCMTRGNSRADGLQAGQGMGADAHPRDVCSLQQLSGGAARKETFCLLW